MAQEPLHTDVSTGFLDGARRSIPVVVAAAPFGLLYGAIAAKQGMSVFEATLMSATIFGGSSQMVGIELFGQTIPAWLVVFSIFAVNFRHVLYSAALGRRFGHLSRLQQAIAFFFLTDPQYAEAEARGQRGVPITFSWYMGMALPIYVLWLIESAVGAAFGALVPNPQALGIDFLLPIYFLALVLEFRHRPRWLPVVAVSSVASVAAYYWIGSPWHVSLGAAAGVLLAAVLPVHGETTMEGGR
jgi:predicted branched-subunit amino acid permease